MPLPKRTSYADGIERSFEDLHNGAQYGATELKTVWESGDGEPFTDRIIAMFCHESRPRPSEVSEDRRTVVVYYRPGDF